MINFNGALKPMEIRSVICFNSSSLHSQNYCVETIQKGYRKQSFIGQKCRVLSSNLSLKGVLLSPYLFQPSQLSTKLCVNGIEIVELVFWCCLIGANNNLCFLHMNIFLFSTSVVILTTPKLSKRRLFKQILNF